MIATLQEWRDFIESNIWKDIRESLEDDLETTKNELVACRNMEDVREKQGRIIGITHILEYPGTVISVKESEVKDER